MAGELSCLQRYVWTVDAWFAQPSATGNQTAQACTCKNIAAMLLKYIGKGLDYREAGDKFGISTSTACMKVNEAMKLLVNSKMHVISKLQRGTDFQRIINGFQRKWNFPQCLGAIDGTHIPIKVPLIHHSDYYNRKSFHSVILQGVCDSHCCFTWCVCWLAWSSTWCETELWYQIIQICHGLLITTSFSHFLSAI